MTDFSIKIKSTAKSTAKSTVDIIESKRPVQKTFSAVIEAMINADLIKYTGCESQRSPNLKLQIIKK